MNCSAGSPAARDQSGQVQAAQFDGEHDERAVAHRVVYAGAALPSTDLHRQCRLPPFRLFRPDGQTSRGPDIVHNEASIRGRIEIGGRQIDIATGRCRLSIPCAANRKRPNKSVLLKYRDLDLRKDAVPALSRPLSGPATVLPNSSGMLPPLVCAASNVPTYSSLRTTRTLYGAATAAAEQSSTNHPPSGPQLGAAA